jgi:hypothetical protein
MAKLTNALNTWGTESFSKTLKQEIEALPSGILPLELATTQGGLVDDSNIAALINQSTETQTSIEIKVGIFFNEIIAGCNCNDDPVKENTYCELMVAINKATAETHFKII